MVQFRYLLRCHSAVPVAVPFVAVPLPVAVPLVAFPLLHFIGCISYI